MLITPGETKKQLANNPKNLHLIYTTDNDRRLEENGKHKFT